MDSINSSCFRRQFFFFSAALCERKDTHTHCMAVKQKYSFSLDYLRINSYREIKGSFHGNILSPCNVIKVHVPRIYIYLASIFVDRNWLQLQQKNSFISNVIRLTTSALEGFFNLRRGLLARKACKSVPCALFLAVSNTGLFLAFCWFFAQMRSCRT